MLLHKVSRFRTLILLLNHLPLKDLNKSSKLLSLKVLFFIVKEIDDNNRGNKTSSKNTHSIQYSTEKDQGITLLVTNANTNPEILPTVEAKDLNDPNTESQDVLLSSIEIVLITI